MIGDMKDSFEDIQAWADSNTASVLLTKPSTYLTGASFAIYESIPQKCVHFDDSPIMLAKNVKNEIEVEGMKSAHVRDAVALAQFAAHLESEIGSSQNWTEISAANLLEDYRRQQPLNDGLSFSTIAAFGPNSAVIHYSPTNETDAKIDESNLFLGKS